MQIEMNPMKVGIIGGGVAGLSAALALIQRAGLRDVRVIEYAHSLSAPHRKGHGLMLMQNGVKALQALRLTHLLNNCTPLKRAIFQNGEGVTIRTETLQDVYCMSRLNLVTGLYEALPDGTVIFDQPCTGVEVSKSSIHPTPGKKIREVRLGADSILSEDEIDLFIGAEGWRSPMCKALNPDLERPISRVLEVVTSTHLPALAAQLGPSFVKTVLSDRGVAFGLLAPNPDRVIGYLQFDSKRYPPPPRGASESDLRHFLHELLQGTPEPVPTYLRQADLSTAHVWRPVDADLPHALYADNSVLIGDAAHPVLPFTSQGVSAALEDAIVLSDAIQSYDGQIETLPDLLASFSETRRREMSAYVEGGRRILENFVKPARKFVLPYVDGSVSRRGQTAILTPGRGSKVAPICG